MRKKINSADGTMNTPTTNIYFPFFGTPYHLILHGKFSGLGNLLGLGNLGVNVGPRIFFLRRESDKSVMVKLHGEKIEIVGLFSGISTTCSFFSQLRSNRCVSYQV